MLMLFEKLKEQLKKKESFVIVAVISSEGSVPRGAGAYMLVNTKDRIWGTIGGGVIEYEATLAAKELCAKGLIASEIKILSMLPKDNLLCGGAARVLLHYVDVNNLEVTEALKGLLDLAEQAGPFWLLLPIDRGILKPLCCLEEAKNQSLVHYESTSYYAEQFQADGNVYIFGGGHVSQELVPVLAHLDFRCFVMDDRAEFAAPELFPAAAGTKQVDYAKLEGYVELKPQDYVIITTRGHQWDTEAERFALQSSARYIGMMGSHFKAKMTKEKLLAEGFSEEQLARVNVPIGLSINSETPAEIAISIAAQLISERAKNSSGLHKFKV